jgi:phytoene desaturase
MHNDSATEDKTAIVIGSGFGGLAAAIRLQAQGFSTTILEQRDKPGGRAYVYQEEGFTFDAGPTVITVPQCLEELFELAGKKMSDYIELIEIQPFYRLFWEDGTVFDYSNKEDELLAQIGKRNPADIKGYQNYLAYAEKVYIEGYEKLGQVPFLRFWDMVKAAPQLVKLNAQRSVYSTISSYIKDDKTRQALSFNSLLIGGNPFEISSVYTLIHPLEKKFGVHFPKGGTGAMIRAMVKVFEDIGGKIHCSSPVERIITHAGQAIGVRVAGEFMPAKVVISNADVHHTYNTLLQDEPLSKRATKAMNKKDFSMSLFVIYFGSNKRFDNLSHHNIMFGERYKGLLNDIFKTGELADDFSIYLHAPSETDSSLAPEGHYSYYALAPVPNLKISDVDWETESPIYAERILKYLEDHYMPGLRESIVLKKFFSPLDFVTELNAVHGSAFSLTPTLRQSAYFRVHNRDDDIKGLYFVGAGTHPGAGIPGVVGSAKATCSVIETDYA